jgi:hypothetical protein
MAITGNVEHSGSEISVHLIIYESGFLDFVHCLYFNKITRCKKLGIPMTSGKEEKDRNLTDGHPS